MSYNIGVNLVEVDGSASASITPAPTSVAGFIVRTERGPIDQPIRVTNYADFLRQFVAPRYTVDGRRVDPRAVFGEASAYGAAAVRGFFENGGSIAYVQRVFGENPEPQQATGHGLTAIASSAGLDDPGVWANGLELKLKPNDGPNDEGRSDPYQLEILAGDKVVESIAVDAPIDLPGVRSRYVRFEVDPAAINWPIDGDELAFSPRPEAPPSVPYLDIYVDRPEQDEAWRLRVVEKTQGVDDGPWVGFADGQLSIHTTPPGSDPDVQGEQALVEQYGLDLDDNVSEQVEGINSESRYIRLSVTLRPGPDGLRAAGVLPADMTRLTRADEAEPAEGNEDEPVDDAAADPAAADETPGVQHFTDAIEKFGRLDIQLLACPDCHDTGFIKKAMDHCANHGERMFVGHVARAGTLQSFETLGRGLQATKRFGALYGPWVQVLDPDTGEAVAIPPDGHVLGVYARTDRDRGLWKAPAGRDSLLRGVVGVESPLNDTENTLLARAGINGIRALRGQGIIIDASRTLSTDPRWRYVGTRRLFNFVKSSLRDGIRWAVHEPNDPLLWKQLRFGSIEPFLLGLWRRGAFGNWPAESVFTVRIDESNNPPDEVNEGRLNVEVSFYPVKPAETIVVRVGQQDVGGTATEN